MTDRLPPFDAATASDAQKAVLAEILNGPRGNLNGPFLGWIASPELAQHAQRLGAFCRYRTGLPLRLSELAILVTAARWRSQAEWHIHYPIALDVGVPAATADAIRRGVEPPFESDDDALIHAFATELYDTRRVSDATFARAGTLRARGRRQSRRAARLLRARRDDAQYVRYARGRTN